MILDRPGGFIHIHNYCVQKEPVRSGCVSFEISRLQWIYRSQGCRSRLPRQTCGAVDSSTGSCSTSVTETVRVTYHIEGLELSALVVFMYVECYDFSWNKKKGLTLENFLDNRYMEEHHATRRRFVSLLLRMIRGAIAIQFGQRFLWSRIRIIRCGFWLHRKF